MSFAVEVLILFLLYFLLLVFLPVLLPRLSNIMELGLTRRQQMLVIKSKDQIRRKARPEYQEDYLEILERGGVLLQNLIQASEEELRAKMRLVAPGSSLKHPAAWSFQWRLSRVPFYVEMKIWNPSKNEDFIWLVSIDQWPSDNDVRLILAMA